ncbi:MAG: hypothetical protein IT449_03655 [Phycisphaerales bacterium]|nr:hypothetical protein [Phycisphaerales bacterium]
MEIAVDDRFTGRPCINNCGQIVFSKEENEPPYGPEIYLYDNGTITQITHNDVSDDYPVINDTGDMAWVRYLPQSETAQLVFVRDGVESVVAENWSLGQPAINNLGHLVWSQSYHGDCYPWMPVIMFWDGTSVTQITPTDEFYDQGPSINDFDEIVWTHMNVCVTPWTGRIQAYWGGQIFDLPSVSSQDQGPAINDLGHVAWSPVNTAVLWRDGELTSVSLDGTGAVSLNNSDRLHMIMWDDLRHQWNPWIVVTKHRRTRMYQIADSRRNWGAGAINDFGEAVCGWANDLSHGDWGGGVLFLRRTRDGNVDRRGSVDWEDYSKFFQCLTGPNGHEHPCACRIVDLDHDGDVDLKDFAMFQARFGLD